MTFVTFINKDNLKIARENMGLDTLSASKQISTAKKNLVSEWENGDSLPTWTQVKKLSKAYNVSELIFFSNQKIEEYKKLPDYRVGAEKESDRDVNKLINLVIKRQGWLEQKLKSEGYPKNSIQGSGRNIDNPLELSKFISQKLNINFQEIKNISGYQAGKKVLKYLINKAEIHGIFVGKTISYHKIEVQDMRGVFISNDYCPYIVLNRKDAVSAQIFSFIHELAHLFRKSEGISNSLDFRKSNPKIDKEETFCNRVAAELLLPENEFDKKFYTKTDIDNLSELYKLSKIFVFYRLKDLGKISKGGQDELETLIKKETAENIIKSKSNKDSGGDYNNNMKDSNGNLFNKIVSNSYLENKIGYTEASHLLNFGVEKYE
ncbi:MAG: XRE family transcriptional regulator [Candidatus Zambryskibacteria bacterium]|nr:XRE family transcriptional regulator [Candidatus Zambryskibacteria bacterium]